MTEESPASDVHPEFEADSQSGVLAHESTPQITLRRFQWQAGLVIVGLALVAQLAAAIVFSDGDIRYGNTYRVFVSVYVVTPLSLISLGVWWLFFSGLAWKHRFYGIVAAAFAAAAFIGLYRFEGFGGDMLPRWRSRLTKSRDAQLNDYLNSQPTSVSIVSGIANASVNEEQPAGDNAKPENKPTPIKFLPGDWPNFRGPNWDSTIDRGANLSSSWESPPEFVWKHPSGVGWSSFAVADGLVFTQEQRGDKEVTVCYELETGNQVWVNDETALFTEPLGGDGPRSTPTVLDSQVFSLGATGILKCIEGRTGNTIWKADILKDANATNLQWAMAGSPLIVDDKVIVNPGGTNDFSLAAYDRKTGKPVWSSGTSLASYSTPQMMEVEGTRFITIYDGDGVSGYSLDGELKWQYAWTNQPKINAAMPLIQGNQVLIGTAYGTGSALLEVSKTESSWKTKRIWDGKSFKPKFNDYVFRNGYVYGFDSGIFACIEYQTGKRQWKRGRYGFGQVILVNDLLIITTEEGEVVLLQATPESHVELGRMKAVEGKTWAHPALIRDLLLVKSEQETACLRLPTD